MASGVLQPHLSKKHSVHAVLISFIITHLFHYIPFILDPTKKYIFNMVYPIWHHYGTMDMGSTWDDPHLEFTQSSPGTKAPAWPKPNATLAPAGFSMDFG